MNNFDISFFFRCGTQRIVLRLNITLEDFEIDTRRLHYHFNEEENHHDVFEILASLRSNHVGNFGTLRELIEKNSEGLVRMNNFNAFMDHYHMSLYIEKKFYSKYGIVPLLRHDSEKKYVFEDLAALGLKPLMFNIIKLMKPQSK